MRILLILISCIGFFPHSLFGQETYNRCDNALYICPNTTYSLNNIGANSTFCAGCEDDFNYCFSGENTIWLYFDTNEEGGNANLIFGNLNFENQEGQGNALQAIVIEASLPCISSSYNPISQCELSIDGSYALEVEDLAPNSRYYVIINGAMGTTSNAEASFLFRITGNGVRKDQFIYIGTPNEQNCKGTPIQLVASIGFCENPSPITWYADGELIGITASNVLTTNQLSDGVVVTAEISCGGNCPAELVSNSLLINVTEFLVDAGPDFEILQGETVQLKGETEGVDIEWSPALNISNPNVLSPFVSPEQTIDYYLFATKDNCTLSDFCTVIVKDALKIPNTFTPNNDGINDVWEILGIEKFPDCFIQVYDRWGQLVFQTSGYPPSKFWDGTSMNGRDLAPSAYYYVINLRSEEFPEPLKGSVSIIR